MAGDAFPARIFKNAFSKWAIEPSIDSWVLSKINSISSVIFLAFELLGFGLLEF